MQRAVGDEGLAVHSSRPGPTRTSSGVTALQLLVAATYASVFALTAVPDPFSLADWSFMLLPPVSFGVVAVLGWRKRVPRSRAWRALPSLAGNAVAVLGFLFTTLLVPLWVLGSFMDWAIG